MTVLTEPANTRCSLLEELGLGDTPITTIGSKANAAMAGEVSEHISPSTNLKLNTANPRFELVATLLASGQSRKQIAATLGISYSTVINLSNQPTVRARIKALLSTHGGNAVKTFLNSQIQSSLDTLVEIRDSSTARPADRISATNAILDRALGKPTQHIETRQTDVADASLEIADLQNRLVESAAKLRERGVTLPN